MEEEVLPEAEDQPQEEEVMAARITGERMTTIPGTDILNRTQIGDNTKDMNGSLELPVLGEVLDLPATLEETEARLQY